MPLISAMECTQSKGAAKITSANSRRKTASCSCRTQYSRVMGHLPRSSANIGRMGVMPMPPARKTIPPGGRLPCRTGVQALTCGLLSLWFEHHQVCKT